MAVAKNTVKAFAFNDQRPAAALQNANLVTIQSTSARPGDTVSFVTAFYGVLDTVSGRLRFSSAGHPPGIVRRASGEVHLLTAGSPVLGVFPEARYRESEDELLPGDLLLLYTDGLTDVRWGSQTLGEERLLALVASLDGVEASQFPETLFERVMESRSRAFGRCGHPGRVAGGVRSELRSRPVLDSQTGVTVQHPVAAIRNIPVVTRGQHRHPRERHGSTT